MEEFSTMVNIDRKTLDAIISKNYFPSKRMQKEIKDILFYEFIFYLRIKSGGERNDYD